MRSENATKCKTLGIQLFQNWRKDQNDLQKYSMGHTHPSSRSSTLGSSEGSSLCSSEGSSTLGSSEGSSWGSSEGSSEGEVVKVSGHCKTSSVRTIILQTEIHWPSVWCMHGNKQALPLLTIKYIYISARNQSSRNDKEMTDYWIYIYIFISNPWLTICDFHIYIYILYRTDYIALQKVRKSVNMFCQNTSGCWMKRRFQCLMPGPGSQAKSTSSIVASVYGDKVIVKVPWRPKMRCLRLRSVAWLVKANSLSL